MDSGFLNLPAPAHPRLIGVPYHGLTRNGWLTLSTGQRIGWPTAGPVERVDVHGDCYLLRVPGTPPVSLTPQEIAIEAAAGREWRNYALLSGRGRNYGGITVGAKAWLYAAPDGTVWRIECAQLDSAVLQPVSRYNPPVSSEWYYPSTLDFTFEIRRFGVISPDGAEAELITRTVAGQSLGGSYKADPVFDANGGAYLNPENRVYPGDGRDSQWMPVAIEDVNSTGSRVIFAVNRTSRQSIWSNTDYAAPRAWLEVSVSGAGASISIAIDVLAVAPSVSAPPLGGAQFAEAYTLEMPHNYVVAQTTNSETGEVSGSLTYTPVSYGPDQVTVAVDYQGVGTLTAGAYYDVNDDVQWVTVALQGRSTGAVGGSGSNSVHYGPSSDTSYDNGRIKVTAREYKVDLTWSISGFTQAEAGLAVNMGGAMYVAPTLTTRFEVSQSGDWGGHFDGEPAPARVITSAATVQVIGSPLGSFNYADPVGQFAVLNQSAINPVPNNSRGGYLISPFTPSPRYLFGAPSISRFDGVRVVRVTNRCYAVIASGFDAGPFPVPYPTGTKVLALGTPAGWTTGAAIESVNYASYNPGTGQLAYAVTEAVGWV